MSASATLLYSGMTLVDGFSERGGTLVYQVSGLTALAGGGGTLPIDEAMTAVPINKGDPFPVSLGTSSAVCQAKRLLRFNSPTEAMVAVYFGVGRWGAAPQRLSTFRSQMVDVTIPVYRAYGTSPRVFLASSIAGKRPAIFRTESAPINGDISASMLDNILANIGRTYYLGQALYVLDAVDATTSRNGRGRLNYRFWTLGQMAGVAGVGDTLTTPDLDYLEEWSVYENQAVPHIEVSPAQTRYPVSGDPLPGLS